MDSTEFVPPLLNIELGDLLMLGMILGTNYIQLVTYIHFIYKINNAMQEKRNM